MREGQLYLLIMSLYSLTRLPIIAYNTPQSFTTSKLDTQLSLPLDRIFGAMNRSPSIDGHASLLYRDELTSTLEDVKKYASDVDNRDFTVGILSDISSNTFRTYTVIRRNGRLGALDVTFDKDTRLPLRANSVVPIRDAVFTWAGIVGIANLWFTDLNER